jgi:aspartyl/asparaginyl-tRNA synthetase
MLLCLLLAGCDAFFPTPIAKILEDPRKYADQSVSVSGEVTEVFSFMVIKYFVVRDKTGQIAVVTDKTLPRKGAQITVHGKVKEAFSLGDQQLLVLVEDGDKK